MAPPKIRQTGHSRKAQFSAFTGYLVAATGAVIGAVLLFISLNRPGTFSGIRGEATDVVAPVGEAGAVGRSGSQSLWEGIKGYFYAGSQNARLQREIDQAHVRLAEAEALAAENRELKALLELNDGPTRPVAIARLIGSTSSSARRLAYLSAGRDDGVAVGMPVRSPLGLVGRVLEVGDRNSRVLLLTDSSSIVPVRRAQDSVAGFAEGRADGTLRIRLNNLGINPLEVGDVFVTSGAGGLYRPGIAVGVAREITRDGAIVSLLGNPAAMPYVAVDPVWIGEAAEVIENGPDPDQSGTGE
ncbi:MAG TPA: rod shape-determining protein MreC [Sphingomonadaceae bacterium]|nr:rod shape-determining protein MreC [Sphingomonadaceae bacterium]